MNNNQTLVSIRTFFCLWTVWSVSCLFTKFIVLKDKVNQFLSESLGFNFEHKLNFCIENTVIIIYSPPVGNDADNNYY